MNIEYFHDRKIAVGQFIDLLKRSTLAERRPVEDLKRIADMLAHANLTCTAWDGSLLAGVARSLTVDAAYQKIGIGTKLIQVTQSRLHPKCKIILLAAPSAEKYYPKIGFAPHHSAWILPAQ
jgi:predicted N-acetyltransferase YhbS